MSINVLVFLKHLPTRSDWQTYLDQAALPIALNQTLEVDKYAGFVPMKLKGYDTGVEVYIDDYTPEYLPEIADQLDGRTKMISFRFSSDLSAACCANGAAAALIKYAGGLAFYEGFQTYEQTIAEYNAFLPDAIKALSGNPLKAGGFDYSPFVSEVQRRIKLGWFPPKLESSYLLKSTFVISTTGEISGIKLENPHPNSQFNDAAIKAIHGISPVLRPEQHPEEPIDMEFTFSYM